jgi:hypothetical protein
MESSKMKNMLVLKNLPSNLVEEAIIILKSNKKVKKLEKIDKTNKVNEIGDVKKEKDYVIKEAEMLVSSYISKLENNNQKKECRKVKESKKYTKLRRYAYIASFIIIIQSIMLVIK